MTKVNTDNRTKKELIKKALKKMLSNKKLVQDYIKGKVDLKTVEEAGIKFVDPL